MDRLAPYELVPALEVERYKDRYVLEALRMVACVSASVWGADITPQELMPLPWEQTPQGIPDTWSYEETMQSGIGLLDHIKV